MIAIADQVCRYDQSGPILEELLPAIAKTRDISLVCGCCPHPIQLPEQEIAMHVAIVVASSALALILALALARERRIRRALQRLLAKLLALQRARDPIIAETIGAVGGAIACLLPLLLACYVLYTTNRNKSDSETFNELLVTEVINDELRLLSGSREPAARLNHRVDAGNTDDSSADQGAQ